MIFMLTKDLSMSWKLLLFCFFLFAIYFACCCDETKCVLRPASLRIFNVVTWKMCVSQHIHNYLFSFMLAIFESQFLNLILSTSFNSEQSQKNQKLKKLERVQSGNRTRKGQFRNNRLCLFKMGSGQTRHTGFQILTGTFDIATDLVGCLGFSFYNTKWSHHLLVYVNWFTTVISWVFHEGALVTKFWT